MKVAATHEAGWKKIMVQGSQNSLKDEWLFGLLHTPAFHNKYQLPRLNIARRLFDALAHFPLGSQIAIL